MSQSSFKKVRLFKVARELNVTIETLEQQLKALGYAHALVGHGANAVIEDEAAYEALLEAFKQDRKAAERLKELRAARSEAARARQGAGAAVEEPEETEAVEEATQVEQMPVASATVPEPESAFPDEIPVAIAAEEAVSEVTVSPSEGPILEETEEEEEERRRRRGFRGDRGGS
jgi:translation initiation factor IF-2